ncbi:MAG: Nramp family divalent metal transporter [Algoriphagus sp.]|uniref:Nramp family divalent metal transporter n=1 Tax=Algoriphagus sp. TaxID=1872435 RepID=UPI00260700CD|nr:Nramp family divalent metal transporter [Algoriphagus sp.]MDG1278347.1 Nramp family divalent metal transporter [Algoriphagus sp.]
MNHHYIQNPPNTIRKMFGFLGPGFILSASIVGSGELIATTILGAEAGFITFWVILVSCIIKVGIQLEFGKNAIVSESSIMAELNNFRGPRLGKVNWSVWVTFLLTSLKILQLGGMLGGAAIAFTMIFPWLPLNLTVIFLGLSVSLLIYKNYYGMIEKIAAVMVFGFTFFTLLSLVAVFFTPFQFFFEDVLKGLSFELPKEYLFVAIGAFGITGVASDEIIAYTYWCKEKGYAAFVGENDGSESWKIRAKGWINVMYLDAFVAMVCYTIVTAAFYLLGAAILHGSEHVPEGNDLIGYLATIYTKSLGPGARLGYLIGAFIALYSSVFATLAYWSRLFPDIFVQLKWWEITNQKDKDKYVKILAWIFPTLWIITYLFLKLPTFMVLIGGVIGSVLLLVIVYAAIEFRLKNDSLKLDSNMFSKAVFWLSVISITLISGYGILKIF